MRWARENEPQAPARLAQNRGPGWAPSPLPPRLSALGQRCPVWLQPTYRGAVCAFGLSIGVAGKLYLLALLGTLMLMVGPRLGVVLFLGVFGVAMVAGGVGGTVHGILRPLDHWGRLGTWLRWLLAIFTALIVSAVLTPHGPFTLQDPALHILALGMAVCGAGVLLLLDDRRPGRPTPRSFLYLQNRDRLWAAADQARARQGVPQLSLAPSTTYLGAPPLGVEWPSALSHAAPMAPSVRPLGPRGRATSERISGRSNVLQVHDSFGTRHPAGRLGRTAARADAGLGRPDSGRGAAARGDCGGSAGGGGR